jgi:hypothetical protein
MSREDGAQASHVSGVVMIDQRAVAERLFGREVVAKAIEAMSEPHRAEMKDLMPVAWCHTTTAVAFHEALAREVGLPVAESHRKVVREGLQHTFSTVWRAFFRLLSIELLVKRTASVYAKSFDTGTLTCTLVDAHHIAAEVTGWRQINDLQIDGLAIGFETILQLAGRKATVTRSRTGSGVKFLIAVE